MYLLLQNRPIIKTGDLAEILGVSSRMIKNYKKDLEEAGIYIGAKKGRYGGYYLKNPLVLQSLKITKQELNALKMACEVIRSDDHVFALDFEILVSKILNLQSNFIGVDYFNKDRLRPLDIKEKEKEFWK